jgi:FAD synthase
LAPLRPYLSSEGETTNRIRALGVEHVAILRFTRKLALCRAKAFLTSLSRRVPMRELWLGPDARVGRGPTGVPDAVAQIGEELGFRTGVFGCGSGAGAGYFPTSGDIEGLNEWLGRRYALTCYVGHPLRRISAELMECEVVTPETLFVPPPGHYAVEGHLPGGSRSAAALMIVREFPETGMPAASLIAHRRLGWAGSHMRIEFLSRWQPEPVDVHCWAVHVVKTQGTADTRNRGRKGR